MINLTFDGAAAGVGGGRLLRWPHQSRFPIACIAFPTLQALDCGSSQPSNSSKAQVRP